MKKKILYSVILSVILLGCNDDRLVTTPLEQVRPTFNEIISPIDSAFAFNRYEPIILSFDEEMDPKSFVGNFHLWSNEDFTNEVKGTFTSEGNNIIFTPSVALEPAHQYYTELYSRVKDINGNGIDKDTTLVATSEFFTSGEYSVNNPEYFICDGSDDILLKVYLENNRLVSDTITALNDFGRQLEMAFTKDGSYLIMTDYASSNSGIYFINPDTYEIEKKLTQNPNGSEVKKSAEIVVSDNFAYVVNQSNNLISVVDLSTKEITDVIELPGTPKGLTISSDYTKAYAGGATSNQIWKIDLATKVVEQTFTIDSLTASVRLAISTDGNTLIVRENRTSKLLFIDANNGNLINILTLNYESQTGNNNDLAVNEDFLYVSSSEGILTKIQISSQSIISEISGVNFQGIDISASNELLIATSREELSKLKFILPDNLKIIRSIPINCTTPWDVAIRP